MAYDQDQSSIVSQLRSLDSKQLVDKLRNIYDSGYEEGIRLSNTGDYGNAAQKYKFIVNYYSAAADLITSVDKFSDLRPMSEFFRDTASYLEKRVKTLQLQETHKESIKIKDRGILLLTEGQYKEALECFDKALELGPIADSSDILNRKGNTYFHLKRFELAIESYDKAIEINPKYSEAWFNKGLVLYTLGDYSRAIESYDKAIEINPKYSEAWFNKGLALDGLSRLDEAVDSYTKAVEINPKHSEAWFNKGLVLYMQGDYSRAIESYYKAIEINPKHSEAWFNKGLVLYMQGDYSRAIESYDKALEINPKYSEAWFKRGLSLHNVQMGKYEDAVSSYYKALELDSSSVGIRANLAEALLLAGRYTESEKIAKEVIERADYETYGFVMRIIIVLLHYLRNLYDEGKNAIQDLLEYDESVSEDFRINWKLDGLRNIVNKSKLSRNEKELLNLIIDLSKMTDKKVKEKSIRKISDLIYDRNITEKVKGPLTNIKDHLIPQENIIKERDINILNTSSPDRENEGWYNWEIFLEAPDKTLNLIDSVKYILHPTFKERERIVHDNKERFKIMGRGWGEFQVKVEIYMKDRSTIKKYHWLKLQDDTRIIKKGQ